MIRAFTALILRAGYCLHQLQFNEFGLKRTIMIIEIAQEWDIVYFTRQYLK
jgi:hypothetical protein